MHSIVHGDGGIRTPTMSESFRCLFLTETTKTYILENPAAAGRDRGAAASAVGVAVVAVTRRPGDRSFGGETFGEDGETDDCCRSSPCWSKFP